MARALGIEMQAFRKPTAQEEAHLEKTMREALRKTVVAPTNPIHTASDFLSAFDQRHASRLDVSAVKDSAALKVAASMADWMKDLNDIWDDVYMSERLKYAHSFVEMCHQIERHGYVCHMGAHKQRQRSNGKPDMIFDVNVMVILPKEYTGTRYAMIQLEDGWETLEADRIALPDDKAD